jgi:hypothetical protein
VVCQSGRRAQPPGAGPDDQSVVTVRGRVVQG